MQALEIEQPYSLLPSSVDSGMTCTDDQASSSASSPSFVSAQQSPINPDSPHTFQTPPIGSAPAERPQGEDKMPPTTRRQGRILAAQAASSSPLETSMRNQQDRSLSPVTRKNLLGEISPQSAGYVEKLKSSVDQVLEALYIEGKVLEANAVQELYNQSFKDAGSRVLLDALLRNRADDRQSRDFKSYMRDVSRLSEVSPSVSGPVQSRETRVLGKRRRREPATLQVVDSKHPEDASSDGGVSIPDEAAESDKESQAAVDAQREDDSGPESESNTNDKTTRDPQEKATSDPVKRQGRLRKKKTRRSKRGRTVRRLGKMAQQQQHKTDGLEGTERVRRLPDAARLNVGTEAASRGQSKTAARKFPAVAAHENPSTSSHGNPASKKDKKMFQGANGPVYLSNTLGLSA